MKRVSTWLTIALITLLLMGGLEVAVRLYYLSRPDPLPRDVSAFAYTYNPDYLIALKPDLKKTFRHEPQNGGHRVTWKTNRLGFRGNMPKDSAGIRVMVFGDSNVQGRFSSFDQSFCGRLENALNRPMVLSADVINAGVTGFGPDQSLIRMKKQLPVHDPDVIIFHIFADNDFGDIIRNRLLELDDQNHLVSHNRVVTLDEHIHPFPPQKRSALRLMDALEGLKRRLGHPPPSPPVITKEDLISYYIERCEEEYEVYERRHPRYFSNFDDHYDFDLAVFPDSEAAKAKVKLMEAILTEAYGFCKAQHKKFLVLIQPSSADLTANFAFSYQDLNSYPGYQPNRLSSIVENICHQRGIPCINLFPVYSANDDPGSLYFKDPDNHWNESGQQLAADTVARTVFSMCHFEK